MGRTKLTDKKKQKIIADYVENGNYSETARMNEISDKTVKRLVDSCEDVVKKAEQKKEENTQDMIQYLESKKQDAFDLVEMFMNGMADEEKIQKTSINQIATAMGIVIDKFIKNNNGEAPTKVVIINDLPNDS